LEMVSSRRPKVGRGLTAIFVTLQANVFKAVAEHAVIK
jgi:hypothetical protein